MFTIKDSFIIGCSYFIGKFLWFSFKSITKISKLNYIKKNINSLKKIINKKLKSSKNINQNFDFVNFLIEIFKSFLLNENNKKK